jgi:trans-aconitate methyltransferase
MKNNWQEVWNRRKLSSNQPLGLQDLLYLDGYDTAVSQITLNDIRAYARVVSEFLGVTAGSSIYEVGCGAGAFLYALRELSDIQVGGADYSSALIDIIHMVIPDGIFTVQEAKELPSSPVYDFVISNGVFHYFSDLDYAEQVLRRMIVKARRAIAILDVPDLSYRDAAERMRRDKFKADEYDRLYAGLEHLYYSRDWFVNIAAAHNMEHSIFTSPIPNYAQSEFRFGTVLVKK